MKSKKSIIIVLVVLLFIAAILTGLYVFEKNKKDTTAKPVEASNQTQPQAVKQTETTTNTNTKKYLVIKEWGIKIPDLFGSADTAEYTSANNKIYLRSTKLSKNYQGTICANIIHYNALLKTDSLDNEYGGTTYKEYFTPADYTNINGTYYILEPVTGLGGECEPTYTPDYVFADNAAIYREAFKGLVAN